MTIKICLRHLKTLTEAVLEFLFHQTLRKAIQTAAAVTYHVSYVQA
jgi:hypothetical protein